MALRTDIVEEKVGLDAVVQRSALGKHINESILRPILDEIEKESKMIMDDLGFMIVAELQHRLATAPPGKTYEVYMVNESAPKYSGGRYEFIGWYTASAKGGPPSSGITGETGLPTGSLYESIWYAVDPEGILSVTMRSPEGSEKHYFFKGGKVFLGFTHLQHQWKVAQYFQVLEGTLDSPGTRPFWRRTMREKRKYWDRWMNARFQKAVRRATRRPTVSRALKINIYWQSGGSIS